MRPLLQRWVRFVLALALLAGTVGCLHVLGSSLPGSTGALIAQNKAQNREVYAYVYSDLGDMREFLDDAGGAFGKAALRRVLGQPHHSP